MKSFKVIYDENGEFENIPKDPDKRLEEIISLKNSGFTHVEDIWLTYYTGETYTPVDVYINTLIDNLP
tara:strand:- start:307 stop:510 length:204 start_codon:yes stop_codon:yes gene_type:complete